jgi:5-methylcytosine-specific restriction endonuclease McrA
MSKHHRAARWGGPRPADKRALVARSGGQCENCGTYIGDGGDVDHVQPLAEGGPARPDLTGYRYLCRPCNRGARRRPARALPRRQW